MRTIVKGKNVEVPDRVRDYAERKLDRLDRLLDDRTDAIVELSNEQHRSAADAHIADVTLVIDGQTLRSHATGSSYQAAHRRGRRQGRAPGRRPQGEAAPARRGPSEEKQILPRDSPTGPRTPRRERADRQGQALRHRADVRGGRRRRRWRSSATSSSSSSTPRPSGSRPLPARRRRLRADRARRRRRVHDAVDSRAAARQQRPVGAGPAIVAGRAGHQPPSTM